jgi:hypothetical protein
MVSYMKQKLVKVFQLNHGYESQSKLRGVMPSAARDCLTYQFPRTSLRKLQFHNKYFLKEEFLWTNLV